MATLATLLVKLVGDISGFSESMGKAEDVAAKAGDSLASKLGGGLATVGKAAAGVALAGIAATSPEARVLICGSLYLAGTVLRENR